MASGRLVGVGARGAKQIAAQDDIHRATDVLLQHFHQFVGIACQGVVDDLLVLVVHIARTWAVQCRQFAVALCLQVQGGPEPDQAR
ncbi:hypothetical protein SDC9_202140 [bioreactor metagenome]|uniref:Uncharacterized protein n=1 Tax=bioreactor metagenome TaxID=1076179 RepID=A0A645IUA1_9ZZZZ